MNGRIDVELIFVQHMERRLMVEREVFINMLQGRDTTQHRLNAKRLGRGISRSVFFYHHFFSSIGIVFLFVPIEVEFVMFIWGSFDKQVRL